MLHGGLVKFQRMQQQYPNSPDRFNILYMVSSAQPWGSDQLSRMAAKRGRKLVWNQNGVAYPGWHGPGWERKNDAMASILHAADYVFYQSEFCLECANRFLGERRGRYEVLYNAVDTSEFTPGESNHQPAGAVVLLGGNQYQRYRLDTALRALSHLRRQHPEARMLVTGRLSWSHEQAARDETQSLLMELGVEDAVEFTGPYRQRDAPALYRRAHVLLHTKYNDPCPGLVVEAMACGLPVVYSASGGVPELVGREAGIGIESPLSFDRDYPPDPEALSDAIANILARRAQYARAARARAVAGFDIKPWLARHQLIFEQLSGTGEQP